MKYKPFDNLYFYNKMQKMNFKSLYSLSFTTIMFAALLSCGEQNQPKTPANAGKKYIQNSLTYKTDTVYVNENNFEHIRKTAAAGLFKPNQNQIILNYFSTSSPDYRIQNFCRNNNKMIPLVRRHETEHARKASLTKNTCSYSATVRGQIAALNEIVAPAAEIIEALDWRYVHGRAFPATKTFIRNADKEITHLMDSLGMDWPVNFNQPEIATVVMRNALAQFTHEFNRGIYQTTVRRAFKGIGQIRYIPATPHIMNYFTFSPQTGNWDAMWEFDSARGHVNMWHAAPNAVQTEIQNALNNFVIRATNIPGKNPPFLENSKIH